MGSLKGDNGSSGFTFNGNYAVWGDADIHIGVAGTSKNSVGVLGASTEGTGVQGNSISGTAVNGFSVSGRGVAGTSDKSYGVFGQSNLPGTQVTNNKSNAGIGVYGVNNQSLGVGVSGEANNAGTGVLGHSDTGTGVMGTSAGSNGIHGITSSNNASAVYGEHTGQGIGVFGRGGPTGGEGVFGQTTSAFSAVYGKNTGGGNGVSGESESNVGVIGTSQSGFGISGTGGNTGVYAHNSTLNPTGGTQNDAYLASPGFAGDFHGNVNVLGKATVTVLEITGGGDLAEPFLVEDSTTVEPGTVMVIDEHHPGNLKIADSAYDRKVAGIVSGANGIGTGLTLQHASLSGGNTLVALTGRVFCKAEAISSPIQSGDLLTTSSLSGHAMKAVSESSSWGAIIGKAMTGLLEGTGFVLVLVNLQ